MAFAILQDACFSQNAAQFSRPAPQRIHVLFSMSCATALGVFYA